MSRIKKYAKKTFLALEDPKNTIVKVFPSAINRIEDDNDYQYMGVKNVYQIPASLIRKLENSGFVLHTIDKHSHNGRAVDQDIQNPITGRPMTGSSSGTAVNVFLGINDLGIGTDGGGSVLAPAIAVNCYGFISPLIEAETMKQYSKKSTDDILFFPSIGFITHDFSTMKKAIASLNLTDEKETGATSQIFVSDHLADDPHWKSFDRASLPVCGNDRKPLMDFLAEQITKCDVFVDKETKIDFYGMGDSVFGHFDNETQKIQNQSGKGLIRVANMVKATAIAIPTKELSTGITLYCESKPEKITKMLALAATLIADKDDLIERYFRNTEPYFEKGFIWNH